MSLSKQERQTLQRIRKNFLQPEVGQVADYWDSLETLKVYDDFFGRRIYFKALSMFQSLKKIGWTPRFPIFDFGCGTGAQMEALLEVFTEGSAEIIFYDRSEIAIDFSLKKFASTYPQHSFQKGKLSTVQANTLLISHVLGEMDVADLKKMENFSSSFENLIFLEAGTQAHFQKLLNLREALRGKYSILAPCTHQDSCPMLLEENSRHWCHHQAEVPQEFSTEAKWAQFSQEMGVDLRSLPYSYLLMRKSPLSKPLNSLTKSIGRARISKAYARILSCQKELGLKELELSKRTHKEAFNEVRKRGLADYYLFEVDEKDRIQKIRDLSEILEK